MGTDYGYNTNASHGAIIFEKGSPADREKVQGPDTEGMIVGTSEWAWITEGNARRICAALKYFNGESTPYIEKLARDKSGNGKAPIGTLVGYRCGRAETRCLDELLKKKTVTRLFEDKNFINQGERPALVKLIQYIRDGDVVYVQAASHLSNERSEFRGIVGTFLKKGAGVHIIDQQFSIYSRGALDDFAPGLR